MNSYFHRLRRRKIWILIWLGAAVLAVCGPSRDVQGALFVPLPPSSPPVRRPLRHPPPPKPVEIVIVTEETVVAPVVDWAGIYQTLPRDSKGVVDWMRALQENLVTPRPGIDPATEDTRAYDSEIEFVPADNPGKAATFRHTTHTQWLSCKNCHPAVFKKKSDNLQFTHDQMEKEGKFCGACHFTVVTVQSGCKGCHAKKKA